MQRSPVPAILLVLLFANAVAMLFFRYFTTVDGPLHVFHASLLPAPWTTATHLSHGVIYNANAMHGWLGDRALMVLLAFFPPERTHALFAAMVSCALTLSMIMFHRANGARIRPATLWLLPVTFNFVLLLGLFHFILAVAIGFGTAAWWKARGHEPVARWLGALMGLVVAYYTHRFGPVLVCMLLLPAFVVELLQERTTGTRVSHRRVLTRAMIASVLLAMCVLFIARFLQAPPLPNVNDLPEINDFALLRPLYLVDHVQEQWVIRCVGVLLLASITVGIGARLKLGRKIYWHDAVLALSIGSILLTWLFSAPSASMQLVAERSQWLAFLMITNWIIAVADVPQKFTAWTIGGSALCVVPLQLVRLFQAEATFAELEDAHHSTMEASAALEPGSLIMPVLANHHWLFQHEVSYVAIDHDGIVLSAKESVPYICEDGKPHTAGWLRIRLDPYWLLRHWRSGIPVEIDQVLFIGNGIDEKVAKHPWPVILNGRFEVSFENEYSRIYTRVSDQVPVAEDKH